MGLICPCTGQILCLHKQMPVLYWTYQNISVGFLTSDKTAFSSVQLDIRPWPKDIRQSGQRHYHRNDKGCVIIAVSVLTIILITIFWLN